MNDHEIIERTIAFAKQRMQRVPSSHGWDHVERVMATAEHIAKTEPEADSFIVAVAAALHDIARADQDDSGGLICHAEEGERIARAFLGDLGLDETRIGRICECILSHRFRNDHLPRSIEARILYDADKLDSIGAVGIGRAFLFSGEVGARLHDAEVDTSPTAAYGPADTAYREFIVKLRFIKEQMLTAEGKRLAEERHRFMELFFERLIEETGCRA